MITHRRNNEPLSFHLAPVTLHAVLAVLIPVTWASAENFVIRNARVFDGHRIATDTDVWVEGDKIKAVGKQLKTSADTKSVDGTNATLLPGLIDSHTHTYGDALKDAIAFGVTTELDMFNQMQLREGSETPRGSGKES